MKANDITLRLLNEAACVLREDAANLKASHTINGTWDAEEIDAMISYAQTIRLARRLTAEAQRLQDEAPPSCFKPPKTEPRHDHA